MRVVALAATCSVGLNACYAYAPVAPGAVPATGTRVQADLTRRGSGDVESRLGADVESVEGHLVAVRGDSVELQVRRVVQARGQATTWSGETVVIPTASIGRLRTRRLSVTRTVAASALVVGIVTFFSTRGFGSFGGGERVDPSNPGGQNPGQGS